MRIYRVRIRDLEITGDFGRYSVAADREGTAPRPEIRLRSVRVTAIFDGERERDSQTIARERGRPLFPRYI